MGNYYTIAVIFAGTTTRYTYLVDSEVKVAKEDYVVVRTTSGLALVRVVEVHEDKQDTESYEYKYISGLMVKLDD